MHTLSVLSVARRHLAHVALALSLVAPTALAPVAVHAQEEQPAVEGADWGPNSNGWNITVINDSSHELFPGYGTLSNVSACPSTIAAGKTDADTRGKASWFDGPANMDITFYDLVGGEFPPGHGSVELWIRSDSNGDVTVSHDQDGDLQGGVQQAVSNKPIVLRITNR